MPATLEETGKASKRAKIKISTSSKTRTIVANGIANHSTGAFPNKGNPHKIESQRYRYKVPLKPKPTGKFTPQGRQPFGIAINGVPFDPGTAEYWNGNRNSPWRYEALSGKIDLGEDEHHAHVQPTGTYHYHGIPNGLIAKLIGNNKKMVLVGWAADGFPIYAQWGLVNPKKPNKGVKKMTSSQAREILIKPTGNLGQRQNSQREHTITTSPRASGLSLDSTKGPPTRASSAKDHSTAETTRKTTPWR